MNAPAASIWLVDDDEDDLVLMQAAFGQVVPEVLIKRLQDGDDLLTRLETTATMPNLVLLDLNMARTGGFDALSSLRASRRFEQLPIVVLTTSTNPLDRKKSSSLGANDYHTKPDSYAELTILALKLVQQWLPQSAP